MDDDVTMQTSTPQFLPVSRADMDARGWDELDVLLITGDAYIDHICNSYSNLIRYIHIVRYIYLNNNIRIHLNIPRKRLIIVNYARIFSTTTTMILF